MSTFLCEKDLYIVFDQLINLHLGKFKRGKVRQGPARELLDQAELQDDPEEKSALDEAKVFLLDLLACGPMASKDVERDANGAGLSWVTVKRAAAKIGVRKQKEGFGKGTWYWSLPDDTEPFLDQEKPFCTTKLSGTERETMIQKGDDEEAF
jgi:hypothetical protein